MPEICFSMNKNSKNFEEYILQFPQEIQQILFKIREIVKQKASDSEESISYGMPAFKTNGKPLVYFAGYKNHIGFYATPSGHEKFKKELLQFKQGKGSVQFPLDKPIPYDLIGSITEFRLMENRIKGKNRK